MGRREKASDVGASKAGGKKDIEISLKLRHAEYITWILTLTTIIAGWNISDIWSGIVTTLLGIMTISFNTIISTGRIVEDGKYTGA